MSHLRSPRRAGISVVELLVVLAILLLLIALLIPAVQKVREAAARTQSTNNLKQMGLAMHNYHAAYNGFPLAVGESGKKTGTTHFFILPFIEQANLFNQATNDVWDNEVWSQPIAIYVDPRDTNPPPNNVYEGWLATTNYPVNWMVTGGGPGLKRIQDVTDGTSNTLMFAERYQVCNGTPTAWGYPGQYTWAPMFAYYGQPMFQVAPSATTCDPERTQAIGGTMLVALCDASCRSINPRLSAATWTLLCDPADGMPLPADFD